MKTTIITAADAGFFELLTDLLDSIDRCRQGAIDVCVLDVGLSPQRRATLDARLANYGRVVDTTWDFDFPQRDRLPRHFQAMFARPFLPKYLPEYERYLYIDADAWLQNWRAIELLLLASQAEVMAIVPEIHRAYAHNYLLTAGVAESVRNHYVTAFGEATGSQLARLPIINAGVWAMRRDVPFWRVWADLLERMSQRGVGKLTEQCALNAALYTGKIAYYPLPAWCNWICSQATPLFDPTTHTLYEPLLPHEELSIVHLADAKDQTLTVECADGTTRPMKLTFSTIRK